MNVSGKRCIANDYMYSLYFLAVHRTSGIGTSFDVRRLSFFENPKIGNSRRE
jgi:hypothetical protein